MSEIKLSRINRWPMQHRRNVDIAITVAQGNSQRKVGKMYGLSSNRVNQIYRIIMSKLCEMYFYIPWHEALHNKLYYNHPDALSMITAYKNFIEKDEQTCQK